VARLESGKGKHSPSLATLQKYAHALGFRLQLKLIDDVIKAEGLTKHSTGRARKLRTG
jgi:transcriptional regulator with XRE-family HTH domain